MTIQQRTEILTTLDECISKALLVVDDLCDRGMQDESVAYETLELARRLQSLGARVDAYTRDFPPMCRDRRVL